MSLTVSFTGSKQGGNGFREMASQALQQLRSIGRSETEEDFREEVERLKAGRPGPSCITVLIG